MIYNQDGDHTPNENEQATIEIAAITSELKGMKYEGMWERDVRHGPGTMIYPGQCKISCNWVNDLPEGPGKIMRADDNAMRPCFF